MRINKNDLVVVLNGNDRGKKARVLKVDKKAGKVTVEGINVVHKHVKRSRRNPQGGRLSMEMPMLMCRVQVVCPKCAKPTRVGAKIDANGVKSRVCKKCDAVISQVTVAKGK